MVKLRHVAGQGGGLPRESKRVHTLLRIDDRPISDDPNEIRAFMTVRDEMLRLRQNLAHHRNIGVRRFLVVDNGSSARSTGLPCIPDAQFIRRFALWVGVAAGGA
jgi:hypothetical protein